VADVRENNRKITNWLPRLVARVPATVHSKLLVAFLTIVVVLITVGVVGLQFDRRPWYFKECEFVVSCSYGPGRYDPAYEELGQDYPAVYVRWTEQRNMQAVLDLMDGGRLDVTPLISHRFLIDRRTVFVQGGRVAGQFDL